MLASVFAFSHTPLLLVEDNGDGTLYAEAGFSDGSGAKGLDCRVEDENGDVVWKGKFDEFNSVEIEIPEVFPYFVVFDAGPGHIVKKEGPAKSGSKASNAVKDEPEAKSEADTVLPQQTVSQPSSQPQPVLQTQQIYAQPVQSSWLPQNAYYGVSKAETGGNEILNTVFLGIITVLLTVIAISLLVMAVAIATRKN